MKEKKEKRKLSYIELEVELDQLKRKSRYERQKLQTLLDISSGLHEAKTFEDIGETIEFNLNRFNLGKGFGVKLAVYDSVEDIYRIVFQTEIIDESFKRINVATNIPCRLSEVRYYSKIAIEQRKTLFIEDSHSEYSLSIDGRQKDVESQSMVFIPLFYRDNLAGLFSCARTPKNSMDQDFIGYLESIARYACITVGELLIEKRQKEQEKLQTLLDISSGLYKANTFEDISKTVVDNLNRFKLGETIGTKLAVYDSDMDEYFIAFQTGAGAMIEPLKKMLIPTNRPCPLKEVKFFSQISIEQKKTLIIQDNQSEYSVGIDIRQKDIPKHSMIFIPLYHREKLVGLLSLARSPENSMDPDFVSFLESIAKYVSIAVGELLNEKRRQKAEQVIIESEKSYRTLVETSPDGIVLTDLKGKILLCNKKIVEIGEYNKIEELIGKSIFELIIPEDRQNVKSNMRELLISESFKNVEYELIKKNGSHFSAEVNATLTKDVNGRPNGAIVTARDITDRKLVEQTLAYERYLFETLMDTLPDSIYFKDRESKFIRINKSLAKCFNLKSPDDAKGKNDFNFFAKERAEEPFEDEKQILLTGQPIVNKDEIEKWQDGRTTWVSTTKMPLKDKNGQIIGTFGISRNITDRKLMEQTLAYERYLFETLLDNVPDMIYFKDKESRFIRINKALAKWLGLKSTFEAVGKHDHDFYLKENVEGYSIDEKQILQTGQPIINKDEMNKWSDGRIAWISTTKMPLKDKDGQIIGTFGISRNITDRKLMEQTLWNEKEELKITLSSVGDGVITTNKEGKIILMNKKAEMITGWSSEESFNRPLSDVFIIINNKNNQVYINPVRLLLKTSAPESINDQSILITKENKDRIIEYNASSIKDKTGNFIGFIIVFRDITEQKRIEAQSALSQKMESIGQLAAGIAHEINTPMQYIGDNTRFLQDSLKNFFEILNTIEIFSQKSENLDDLKDSCSKFKKMKEELDFEYLKTEIPSAIEQTLTGVDRVRKIVLALKDFAHPGVKEKQPSDLNHGIEVTATISRSEWKYVSELETDLEEGLPPVYCVIDEINQVMLNMIVNSAHAITDAIKKESSQKGKIIISTRKEDQFVKITISDTGKGIPKSNLNKIFDPFFTTKVVGKGTGQGLAIAHDIIVNKHKGTIQVESEVGKGTTFIIRLPISDSGTE
jgi:PAS domain S-box-containing protein